MLVSHKLFIITRGSMKLALPYLSLQTCVFTSVL